MKTVIVASIKGGTGKSLISAMLAMYISQEIDTFLIDSDVDSPNLADILKVDNVEISTEKVEVAHIDDKLDFFSVGLYTKRAISMSGESYVQILTDLLSAADVKIDTKNCITIIDAPAGASSLFKYCLKTFSDSIVGILAITTPTSTQDLERLIEIAKYYGIPVIGVVENMAYFKCECGKEYRFSDGTAEAICMDNNIDYLGEIPISPEIQELMRSGIPYIPDYVETILEKAFKKIKESEAVFKDNILSRFVSKVSDKIKKNIAKIIANTIIKVNKEINLKKLTDSGFGNKVVEVVILDKGEKVINVHLKLTNGRLVVLKKPKNVDITILTELDALIKITKGELSVEDAFYLGDIEIYGKSGTIRALTFLQHFYDALKHEIKEV